MSEEVNRETLAEIWARILSFTEHPQDVFGLFSERLLDRQASDEDRLPHPGYVGRNYSKGGLLFLAMNPGNGPTNGPDPAEAPHYEALRSLRHARSQVRRLSFDALMSYDESWYPQIRIMTVVVKPIMDGTGTHLDSIAYMNVLKWRTKKSSGLAPLYRLSMKAHTLDQLEALDPGLIVILGTVLSNELEKIPEFHQRYWDRTVTIPRTNGDRYLKPEGHAAVRLACERFWSLPVAPTGQELRKSILVPKVIKISPSATTPVHASSPRMREFAPKTGRKAQADKNRDQAWEFRREWHAKAETMGIPLRDFILVMGRDNDVTVGMKGPRHAIVTLAQQMAKQGKTYGDVLGKTVPKGNGERHTIGEGDLLGYVVANDYCTLIPPAKRD